MSATTLWVVTIATGVLSLALKVAGHVVPARWLEHPRLTRINALVPIVLLSALVVAEALVERTRLVLDHRLAGVAVALGLLLARAPFPVVVVGAALASALVYHLH
ncbi:MAG TPA: AzlD domain-containing protein [Acidimicrobiales bacterium]|nr:MAG: branched-chain amino acid transporter AzlD [Actinobacteria bacterium 21-73-9]HQU26582.1 AzlD domain-containing protein [Acidimicrobiales bacterium]